MFAAQCTCGLDGGRAPAVPRLPARKPAAARRDGEGAADLACRGRLRERPRGLRVRLVPRLRARCLARARLDVTGQRSRRRSRRTAARQGVSPAGRTRRGALRRASAARQKIQMRIRMITMRVTSPPPILIQPPFLRSRFLDDRLSASQALGARAAAYALVPSPATRRHAPQSHCLSRERRRRLQPRDARKASELAEVDHLRRG